MKKLFAVFILILIPLTTFAQDKMFGVIYKHIEGEPQKMTKQELNSKLVNEWGDKKFKFLELKNGSLIPMSIEKSKNLLRVQGTQDVEPWVYVVIVVGIFIIIIVLLALLMEDPTKDLSWN